MKSKILFFLLPVNPGEFTERRQVNSWLLHYRFIGRGGENKPGRVRKAYHDANHHCYAYRLGLENQAYRINDDGEPSGSAGKPIYGQFYRWACLIFLLS